MYIRRSDCFSRCFNRNPLSIHQFSYPQLLYTISQCTVPERWLRLPPPRRRVTARFPFPTTLAGPTASSPPRIGLGRRRRRRPLRLCRRRRPLRCRRHFPLHLRFRRFFHFPLSTRPSWRRSAIFASAPPNSCFFFSISWTSLRWANWRSLLRCSTPKSPPTL